MKEIITFELALGEEYYNNGIVEIHKKYWGYFPDITNQEFTITLFNSNQVIAANFVYSKKGNRKSIKGKNPLKDWYKKYFKIKDKVKVSLYPERRILIFK